MPFQQKFYHSFMKRIKFKLTFFVNKLIVTKESKNQWFLYGWRYDGTLFFYLPIFIFADLSKAHQANDKAVMPITKRNKKSKKAIQNDLLNQSGLNIEIHTNYSFYYNNGKEKICIYSFDDGEY